MYSDIKEPQQRLSRDAVKVWVIREIIETGTGLIILGILLYLDHRFAWKAWIGWILYGLLVIDVLAAVWSWINSYFLYKNWRYDVSEEFLQLKSGVLNEKHHLVPMTKIQAVATQQGPILKKYGLCSVTVDTMGSSHTIPALPKEDAIALRNQIARYAKIKEVES
ncbi:PH domain-containing protein [Heyndrickxia acidiproducens]|uniref:PH domain-containing protein n=1 Tax=Heyndrickxia acidiproducens TaxID=1121084 RepID=UPI00036BF713|nr:PH domain-containing protein [Heyndrickxia acidiproducens]